MLIILIIQLFRKKLSLYQWKFEKNKIIDLKRNYKATYKEINISKIHNDTEIVLEMKLP